MFMGGRQFIGVHIESEGGGKKTELLQYNEATELA
jgi:hypothetical protein